MNYTTLKNKILINGYLWCIYFLAFDKDERLNQVDRLIEFKMIPTLLKLVKDHPMCEKDGLDVIGQIARGSYS